MGGKRGLNKDVSPAAAAAAADRVAPGIRESAGDDGGDASEVFQAP